MNKLLVILGPTSSGKSDIAVKLAKKFDGEVISADSRQIFRGMDIGTGKIERDQINLSLRGVKRRSNPELSAINAGSPRSLRSLAMKSVYISSGVPHHMIDIISPRTDFNAAKFKKRAEKIIADILRRDKLPIICGGTGFWIKAIVDDVNFPEVKPDWKLREKLEKKSAERLFLTLKKLDPERAENIDAKNKVRLIRAIEICKAIGKVPSVCHSDRPAAAGSGGIYVRTQWPAIKHARRYLDFAQDDKINFVFLQIGIKLPKEKLHKNIEKRVHARFKQGMVGEVENMHAEMKLSWKKIQSFGLAYFWIPLYLQNKISLEELTEKVIQAEKNYAKRQMTWFKRDKRIKWLENYREIEKAVKFFLKQKKRDRKFPAP